jgi:amino acid adenylation domain-containing protein
MKMLQENIEGFELSPQQKHLWFLQSTDGNLPYRAQCTVLYDGYVNPDIFKVAIEYTANCHEILRTSFKSLPGMALPLQVICKPNITQSSDRDLSNLSPEEQVIQIKALWDKMSQLHFDPDKGNILYCNWVKLFPNKYLLMLAIPALCADTTGLKNLVRAINRCYSACLNGEEIVDGVIQYIDISSWQNELIEAEDRATGRAYWLDRSLTDSLALRLPFENKFNPEAKFAPCSLSVTIAPEIAESALALAEKQGISIDVLLLTSWQILLSRLTGQSNIVVGTAFDGRKYDELKESIGLMVRYLPITCCIKDGFTFGQTLKQIARVVSDAGTWQDYFTWSQVKASHNNLEMNFLPFSFDFERLLEREDCGNFSFSMKQRYVCCDRFKLKLSCLHQSEDLIAEFSYDENLFSLNDVKCLAGQFQTLLTNIVNYPENKVSDLEIIGDAERDKLLLEFNDTQTDFPRDKCIHHLFEWQAAQKPDEIAVVCEEQELTYRQLNERAEQLAHQLRNLGVKPDTLVAICLERAPLAIAAIFGVLKAGGAYVPLDPEYPQQRLAFILEDTRSPILITQNSLLSRIPETQATVICLDADRPVVSSPIVKSDVQSSNLAYIIYTSGSTGKPKGVVIDHRNLVHSTTARFIYYSDRPVSSYLLLSSLAFDSSVAGIFWTLCQGGKLVLPPPGQLDPVRVNQLVARHQVSHLLCLPSLYNLILESAEPEQLRSLTAAIMAGESCPVRSVELHQRVLPLASLFNEYGPTEATVWSAVHKCRSGIQKNQVPIGCPIPNTQIYILDENLKPVAIGVTGEIYIGGEGISRGYLNRPELTAEKFIANPFADLKSEAQNSIPSFQTSKLYKTGDLGRYLGNGEIEFIGRSDNQVKIRGFRVEITEIEEILTETPAVKQGLVVAEDDPCGNQRLVSYIVPNSDVLAVSDLRMYLQQRLPEYAIPSSFYVLETLPLTPNGKVDRRALSVANNFKLSDSRDSVPPRDSLELEIAKIWSDTLNIYPIGVRDNFFQLGGHSILAISLMNKIHKQLGKNLPFATLFQEPTIEAMASLLRKKANKSFLSPLVGIQPKGTESPLFCIHSAGGTVLGYYKLAYLLNPEQPFYGLQARGIDLAEEPHARIDEMASYYIQSIRSVQPQGSYKLAGWSFGGLVAFEIAQQLLAQNQQVSFLGMLDTFAPSVVPLAPADDAALLVDRFGQELSLSVAHLQKLEPSEQLIYVLDKAKKANQLPPDFQLPQAQRLLEIYRLNNKAIQSYAPQHYPSRVTLLRASEEIRDGSQDLSQGWGELVGDQLEIQLCPGNHRTMLDEPHVRVLAQKLQACLDAAHKTNIKSRSKAIG